MNRVEIQWFVCLRGLLGVAWLRREALRLGALATWLIGTLLTRAETPASIRVASAMRRRKVAQVGCRSLALHLFFCYPTLMDKINFKKIHDQIKGKGRLKIFESLEDRVLWLEEIEIFSHHRGMGTSVLMQLVDEADHKQWGIQLCADPTDKKNDPGVYHLIRWYYALGFELITLTEDGPMMFREPKEPQSIIQRKIDYAHRKRAFMSEESFLAWLSEQDPCWDGLDQLDDLSNKKIMKKKSL